jgi:Bacterial PH domain
MFWTLSFELLPGEEIIDDTTRKVSSGIKPAYSVFLTNKRAIFRFDGLGSSLAQSFFYHEIQEVATSKRLFFTYLDIKAKKKTYLLHIADAPYWAKRILEIKNQTPVSAENRLNAKPSPESRKRELMDMLIILRKHSLLNDSELEEKVQQLDSMKL